MKIGSLCSGYGGLDMAVEAYYQSETVWMCDIDKYASIVIKQRWGLPNLGDMKSVNWSNVEPVDILTAGYPCQPFSTAGQRKGSADERHLWPYIKKIISQLQPSRVILENVRGHLTLGFKEVLEDLTEIGYDAKWSIVRASDVGAPHRRERLFVIAKPTNSDGFRGNLRGKDKEWNQGQSQFKPSQCSKTITDSNGEAHNELRRANRAISKSASQIIDRSNRNEFRGCVEASTNTQSWGTGIQQERDQEKHSKLGNDIETITNTNDSRGFGDTQRPSGRFNTQSQMRMQRTPNPLDMNNKLNPQFVEYMMGLPVGWVTDLEISRSQQLKLLGNGVVPQQAYYAIDKLERF